MQWEALREVPAYEAWRGRQKDRVDKQLQGGLVVALNR